jgi:hypothetical protein
MAPAQTVVAFADSPAVRETLSILLEHECQLGFRSPDHLTPDLAAGADLAVVALHHPASVLHDLTQHCPALPIVAVEIAATRLARQPGVVSVPLEPQAIRTAVRERLPAGSHDALRPIVHLVAHTVQTELAYSFAALRTFAPLDVAMIGSDTYALFAAIMREQLCVIANALEQLERFQGRPRALRRAPLFALALCRALAQPDSVARERGLLCRCATDAAAPPTPGPVELASLTAEFLRRHLQRRSQSPVANVQVTASGIVLRYPTRAPAASPGGSWPLLLASLLLQRWSWRVRTARDGDDEIVAIGPA